MATQDLLLRLGDYESRREGAGRRVSIGLGEEWDSERGSRSNEPSIPKTYQTEERKTSKRNENRS
jgi:hypothetical protein